MGTFMGHVIPGVAFLLAGLWWTCAIFKRYYTHLHGGGAPFTNTLTYPLGQNSSRADRNRSVYDKLKFHMESIIKIALTSIGIVGEVVTALDPKTHAFIHIGNGQHITMYAFFLSSGIVDLMMGSKNRCGLPHFTDYIFAIMAFVVEGLLFSFHLHGRSPLDVELHTLLVYTIWGAIGSLLLEMWAPKQVLAGLARAFFVLLQGTWFIQVGEILYPPIPRLSHWDPENHKDMQIGVILYCLHMFAIFTFQLIVGLIVYKRVSRCRRANQDHHSVPFLPLTTQHAAESGDLNEVDSADEQELYCHSAS